MEEKLKYKLSFSVGIIIFGTMYYVFSSPGSYAINNKCEINKFTNKIRYLVQGNYFWERQLRSIDSDVNILKEVILTSHPDYKSNSVDTSDSEDMLKRLYQMNPDLRPTPAQLRSQELRDEADRLDAMETYLRRSDVNTKILNYLVRQKQFVINCSANDNQ